MPYGMLLDRQTYLQTHYEAKDGGGVETRNGSHNKKD